MRVYLRLVGLVRNLSDSKPILNLQITWCPPEQMWVPYSISVYPYTRQPFPHNNGPPEWDRTGPKLCSQHHSSGLVISRSQERDWWGLWIASGSASHLQWFPNLYANDGVPNFSVNFEKWLKSSSDCPSKGKLVFCLWCAHSSYYTCDTLLSYVTRLEKHQRSKARIPEIKADRPMQKNLSILYVYAIRYVDLHSEIW